MQYLVCLPFAIKNSISSLYTCTDFLKELSGWFVPNFSKKLQISCECGFANIRLSLCIIPDRLDDVDRGPVGAIPENDL